MERENVLDMRRRNWRGGVLGGAGVDVTVEAEADVDAVAVARVDARESRGGVDARNGEPAREVARDDGRESDAARGRSVAGGAGAQPKSAVSTAASDGSGGGVASSSGEGRANADTVARRDASWLAVYRERLTQCVFRLKGRTRGCLTSISCMTGSSMAALVFISRIMTAGACSGMRYIEAG